MSADTIHLREEMLIASDYFQQLEWLDRAVEEAHRVTVQRAFALLDEVNMMLADKDNLTDSQRFKLLRILQDVEDQIADLKWVSGHES